MLKICKYFLRLFCLDNELIRLILRSVFHISTHEYLKFDHNIIHSR